MTESQPRPPAQEARPLVTYRWTDPTIVALAFAAFASGFAQFGVVAALGDVSKQLGHAAPGASIADRVGLSGTELGVGLAIIRFASLGSLPLVGFADRFGRRTMLVATLTIGLALTVVAAASPGYWWFVAIFAAGRPLLSATNALSEVMAAEETSARDRCFGGRADRGRVRRWGRPHRVHPQPRGEHFRIPRHLRARAGPAGCGALPPETHHRTRPVRGRGSFDRPTATGARRGGGPRFRKRLVVLAVIGFAISVVAGPANSFVFLYAQDVLHQRGYVTALMVVGAGVTGLVGLLAGRWMADRLGRRPTATLAMVGLAGFGTLAYAGGSTALIIGYVLGVLAGGILAPRSAPSLPSSSRLRCGPPSPAGGWLPASSERSSAWWPSVRSRTSTTGSPPLRP